MPTYEKSSAIVIFGPTPPQLTENPLKLPEMTKNDSRWTFKVQGDRWNVACALAGVEVSPPWMPIEAVVRPGRGGKETQDKGATHSKPWTKAWNGQRGYAGGATPPQRIGFASLLAKKPSRPQK